MQPFPHREEFAAGATARKTAGQPIEDPHAQLERALMDEYIRLHCYDPESVRFRPEADLMTLLEAASEYAAGKLAEFESRAHDVHDIRTKD
jgi:hypothetical protein